MRVNNTPPIDATGEYVLDTPFQLEAGKVYRCEAIEGFQTLQEEGIDVFETFYVPYGIDQSVYEEDEINAINIITLMSDSAETVYVPSSFILKFPNDPNVPYSHTLISVDLGVLPDGVDLQEAIDAISSYVAEVTGVPKPAQGGVLDVQVHLLSLTDRVSYSEHQALELNRAANIDASGREAAFVTIRRQAEELQAKQNQINTLQALVIQLQNTIDQM